MMPEGKMPVPQIVNSPFCLVLEFFVVVVFVCFFIKLQPTIPVPSQVEGKDQCLSTTLSVAVGIVETPEDTVPPIIEGDLMITRRLVTLTPEMAIRPSLSQLPRGSWSLWKLMEMYQSAAACLSGLHTRCRAFQHRLFTGLVGQLGLRVVLRLSESTTRKASDDWTRLNNVKKASSDHF